MLIYEMLTLRFCKYCTEYTFAFRSFLRSSILPILPLPIHLLQNSNSFSVSSPFLSTFTAKYDSIFILDYHDPSSLQARFLPASPVRIVAYLRRRRSRAESSRLYPGINYPLAITRVRRAAHSLRTSAASRRRPLRFPVDIANDSPRD